MARNHVNKPLKLSFYNSRQDEEREVTIVPRTGWGGEGLLGCAIRFCSLEGVRDRVWHILVKLGVEIFQMILYINLFLSFRLFSFLLYFLNIHLNVL